MNTSVHHRIWLIMRDARLPQVPSTVGTGSSFIIDRAIDSSRGSATLIKVAASATRELEHCDAVYL